MFSFKSKPVSWEKKKKKRRKKYINTHTHTHSHTEQVCNMPAKFQSFPNIPCKITESQVRGPSQGKEQNKHNLHCGCFSKPLDHIQADPSASLWLYFSLFFIFYFFTFLSFSFHLLFWHIFVLSCLM